MNDDRMQWLIEQFLRGDISVADFRVHFLLTVHAATTTRPYTGNEVRLYDLLTSWESAQWTDRASIVDRIRAVSSSMISTDVFGAKPISESSS